MQSIYLKRIRSISIFVLFLLTSCQGKSDPGALSAGQRARPLSSATRADIEGTGGTCSPTGIEPTICTWSSEEATCAVTFASDDTLTHMRCEISALVWDCADAGDVMECRWSDDPSCADVYEPDGVFVTNRCDSG